MSAKVNICSVNVLDNPSKFSAPVAFEITFEAFEALPEDLEWKIVYVGSAESDEYDQLLDSVLIGPTPEGVHRFKFEADSPNVKNIPAEELIGVTVVLLACSYRAQQFITIGFYVSVEYEDPDLQENRPNPPQYEKLTRRIVTEDPRVTRYPIKWTDVAATDETSQPATSGSVQEGDAADMEMDTTKTANNCENTTANTNTTTAVDGGKALSDLTNGHANAQKDAAVCVEPEPHSDVIAAAQTT
jgi:histone chaperone ASF1